ncbi:Endoplasmatic reticulum retrieval protein 1B isoform 1 [Hibiscus syriacus]|uniref:Endoplasmatic reticulum retrieval protein 1B isoform 1 n=1 Tax=Hibiscus syriacus TaxID=106335 RepID=A0A6A2Y8A7_HIBSY|nr:Endoplasmatic reticulum retrieval protein 1B isoform 1 [Hibiscus syriacus]
MGDRIFVVIFFFWAALTIITPTLVLLSESSKPFLDTNGQTSEGIKDRRMIGYGVKRLSNSSTSSIQMKASIDHNWSWHQQLESLVSRVFQKAKGLLISTG